MLDSNTVSERLSTLQFENMYLLGGSGRKSSAHRAPSSSSSGFTMSVSDPARDLVDQRITNFGDQVG